MSTSDIDRQLQESVNIREEVREKAYRDDRSRKEDEFYNNLGVGGSEMTKQELRKIIDGDPRMYYRTEKLNDKLYMHYKGWRELKNLEGWTGLKTIYAECNTFTEISGLQNCRMLRSLFLQENCITRISGLENCPDLWSINLSSNFIERIEGLSALKGLNTLMIAKNKLGFGGITDLEQLADTNIGTLDIQDNRIDDPDVLPEVLARMPGLRVLYMKGNTCAKKIVNYRKSTTVYCKDLRYLDDRPVFEDDRREAEAFNRGGIGEQRAEMKLIRDEKTDKADRNRRRFQEMIDDARRCRQEKDAMRAEDKYTDETDPVECLERRAQSASSSTSPSETDSEEDEGVCLEAELKKLLKDDAKKDALKCIRQEKEGEEHASVAIEGQDNDEPFIREDDEQKATEESRDTVEESVDLGAGGGAQKEDNRKLVPSEGKSPDKAVDNRKLVYDDIWDGAPSFGSAAPAPRPPGPPTVSEPAAAEGVFMPWAEGAIGMDAMAPSQELIEKRKAALRAKAAETASGAACADAPSVPSWHSKYQEKMQTQVRLEGTQSTKSSIFAPPPRKAETLATNGDGELDEMD